MTGRFIAAALVAGGCSLAIPQVASAQNVSATAEVLQAVQNGPLTDVQFRVAVANGDASPVSNVVIVFEDQLQLRVGDVAPGGVTVSAPESRAIDHGALPTDNYPLRATLSFAQDGVNVELPVVLRLVLGGQGAN